MKFGFSSSSPSYLYAVQSQEPNEMFLSNGVVGIQVTALYSLNTAHYTLHNTHYTLHTAKYTLHTAHFRLHTAHYTLHIARYTLQTLHNYLTPILLCGFW